MSLLLLVQGKRPLPTYDEFREPILQNEKVDCTRRLEELKLSWEITRCTVMSGGWSDKKDMDLLNFLVNCSRGRMFIKSIHAFSHVKDATLLCELLDGFIQEVGLQNVVQVITDNATNYGVTGRFVTLRYPTLFWTPCVVDCIHLIFEDMGKIPYIKDIIELVGSITNLYIIMHLCLA
jgi:hypothetical protein